jgi:ferritin-like metal-binding protein YciE
MDTLQELLEDALSYGVDAEKHVAKAHSKMAKKATSEALAGVLQTNVEQVERRIELLNQLFLLVGAPVERKKCSSVRELIREAEASVKKAKVGCVRDAAIIAAAEALTHFEISRYSALQDWSRKLGLAEADRLLDEKLNEWVKFDQRLRELANSELNVVTDENPSERDDDGADETKRQSAPRRKKSKPDTGEHVPG